MINLEPKDHFNRNYDKTFTGVQLLAPNFRGLERRHVPVGMRSFGLILPEDIGPDMWSIRSIRTDDGKNIEFVQVWVPNDFDFSNITLDGRTLSDSPDDMAALDLGKNLTCDVHIIGRPWEQINRIYPNRPKRYGVKTVLVSMDAKTN